MDLKPLRRQATALWRDTGPVTRALCIAVFGLNLLVGLLPVRLASEVFIGPETLPKAGLPAIVLDGLLVLGAGFTGLLITLALVAWVNHRQLLPLWRSHPERIWQPGLVVLGIVAVLHLLVMPGRGAAVVLDVLILGYLGRGVEAQLRRKDLVRLLLVVLGTTGLVTAALLWLWHGSYEALLTHHAATPSGTRALLHALMVAWALPHARRTLHPLPITGLHVIWFLTVLAVFDLLFSGVAEGARALTAIVVTRALLEGGWHPRTWRGRLSGFGREVQRGWSRLRGRNAGGRGPTVH